MSKIKCYISYTGFPVHHDILSKFLDKMERSEYFFSKRYSGSIHYDQDSLTKIINESDIFIIFGTKSYFSLEITIQEFEIATKLNKKILFLTSSEINEIERNDGFNENEQIKKAKYWIEIMKRNEQYQLPPEVINKGEWDDDLINSIKQSISKLLGERKKKLVYISYDEDYNYYYINTLQQCLNKDIYSFKTRLNISSSSIYAVINDVLHDEIKRLIESSDIIILYVSGNFFDSPLKYEFDHALEVKKPIFCLLTPSIKYHETRYIGPYEEKYKEIQTLIKIMKTLNFYELRKDFMYSTDWNVISRELEDRINEIIKDNQPKPSILKYCPSNILIKDFDKFFKLEWVESYLLRGTIANDNKIGIIDLNKEFFSISFYDVNEIEKNKRISFSHSYDASSLKPILILTKNENELLLVNGKDGYLIVFDKKFIQTRRVGLGLFDYNDMAIDEETEDVYFVKCVERSNIKVYDYKNYKEKIINWSKTNLLKSEKFKPRFIRVGHDKIFIVNACSVLIDKKTREIKNSQLGENHIYVLDKNSFDIKVFIDLNERNMCQPWNLIIDKDSNIYTTCSLIENKRIISNERYLIKLDKDGGEILSIKLEHTYLSNDMIFIDDKLVFFKENEMIIYTK